MNRDYVDPPVLARLAGIPLLARRPMRGNVSGRHQSPTRGSSVEFAQYRKYVPGDDLRRLDWRAHGRSDRYYVKEFEADTNLRCCLVLDTSGSMGYGTGELTKLQYSLRLAAAIAYLAVGQGDAVGLSCFAGGVTEHLPPRRNPAQLRAIYEVMDRTQTAGETHLIDVLHELAETTAQAAMVIVLSDFFVDPGQLRGCFEHLRFRKHDLTLFHLLDPQELAFDFQRPTRFLDMEGGAAMFADPNEIRLEYNEAMRNYFSELDQVVMATAADYHRVTLDQSYVDVLTRFLTRRTRS